MKNWEPLVLGPELAILSSFRYCFGKDRERGMDEGDD